MLAAIWELMKKGEAKLSAEELALLELMSVLAERFEEEHYPIPDSPPHRILQHLMESRNAKQADLVPILGGRGRISELVNGKRATSKAQAKRWQTSFTSQRSCSFNSLGQEGGFAPALHQKSKTQKNN